MHIDLTPLIGALLPLALAAVAGAVPALLVWGAKHISLLRDVAARDAIDMAVSRAAGLAYTDLLQASAGAHVTIHNQAIAKAAQYVVSSLPPELARLRITPDHLSTMVTGELGKLLSADTGVTVGAAGIPPATNVAGAPVAATA